jgi:hypothetical protein
LEELGYVAGRDFEFVSRFANFQVDRLPNVAAEIVALEPAVIDDDFRPFANERGSNVGPSASDAPHWIAASRRGSFHLSQLPLSRKK